MNEVLNEVGMKFGLHDAGRDGGDTMISSPNGVLTEAETLRLFDAGY